MTAQLIADLKETKRQLQTYGRCTRGARDDYGAICLAVAAGYATRDCNSLAECRRRYAVLGALQAQLTDGADGIVGYNEDPATTDADVYNLIDKALAEAGGLA